MRSLFWRMLVVLLLMTALHGCAPGFATGPQPLRPILESRNLPDEAWQERAHQEVEEATRVLLASPLGVDDALRVALLNHPELRANMRTFDAERARAMDATVLANPEVGSHVLFGADDIKVEADIEFPLTPLMQRSIRREIERGGVERARIEAALFVLEFTHELQIAYYEHVANLERRRLEEEVLALAEASATTAETLSEAGNITGLELVTHQAFASETRRAVFDARIAYATSRARLHRAMGLDSSSDQAEWEVLERLPEVPAEVAALDEILADALEGNLGLAVERRRLNANHARLRLERQQRWLPHVGIGIATEYEGDEWKVGPSLKLGLPFFDRRRHAIDALQAEELAAQARQEARYRHLHVQAEEIHQRMVLAHQVVSHLEEELLPLRGRVVEEALLQYNAMELSVFDLLRARRDQIRAERDRVEALLEFWVVSARKDHLLAGGSMD